MDQKKGGAMSVSNFTVFVLFLIILATSQLQLSESKPKPPKPVHHSWLVMLYPPGFCLKSPTSCQNPVRAKTQMFSIHGLWPTDVKGNTLPRNPNASAPTVNDLASDPSLGDELDLYWPNMNSGFNSLESFQFWVHEWSKHGSADPLYNNNAILYFRKTISMRQLPGGNLSLSLENNDINPGNSYPKDLYRSAIELGNIQTGSIVLICYKDNNIFHLVEVRICVDPQETSFIACNQKEKQVEINSCGTGEIMYD